MEEINEQRNAVSSQEWNLGVKYECATQDGGWIGNLKIILVNPHNKQSNVLIKIESNKFVQSKHNN